MKKALMNDLSSVISYVTGLGHRTVMKYNWSSNSKVSPENTCTNRCSTDTRFLGSFSIFELYLINTSNAITKNTTLRTMV